MQRKIFLTMALAAALGCMTSGLAFAADEIKLAKAAVYRNDTLEGGKLAPVMLLSYEGNDYYLTPGEQAKQLEALVEHTINAEGTVVKDAAGRMVMTIKSFKEAFN